MMSRPVQRYLIFDMLVQGVKPLFRQRDNAR